MKSKKSKSNYDLLDKNPDNWRGFFYYNPNDPRIFVTKAIPSLGWTLNFGNIFSYLVLGGIIILIVMIGFLLA
ncbi:MAG: DUF5808 domain-containing protein [Bacteroidales bacterium]|jgi:uncharacterized membrane protein|nr:DUF5808 domain-containing protein [Bacteroidales bacterium]